jgi:hypothetical protein
LVREVLEPLGFQPFRPSDVIRAYAQAHNRTLASRRDYLEAHRLMVGEDPEAITRPILALKGLVVLDGLRVYNYARTIRDAVGHERYRTGTLECPELIRLERVHADLSRRGRDASQIVTPEDFNADDLADMSDPDVNMQATMDMHDLSAHPFDTSGAFNYTANNIRQHVLSFLAAQQTS